MFVLKSKYRELLDYNRCVIDEWREALETGSKLQAELSVVVMTAVEQNERADALAAEVDRLKAELESLASSNARLARERELFLFHEILRYGDGWQTSRGELGKIAATRAEAVERYIAHLHKFWDWPSEVRRRRDEEAIRVAEETSTS